MKKFGLVLVLGSLLGVIYSNRVSIYDFYYDNFIPLEEKVSRLKTNEYYRDYNFDYVQNTNNFIPQSRQDVLNIYYTIINSGMREFTFYCDDKYVNCQNDVNDIANNQNILSTINNFVHPYNSFKSIKTQISSIGEVKVSVDKIYSEKMIYLIDYEIDKIIDKEITTDMDNKTKIRKIHDYIINNTKYDKARTDDKISKYSSDNAYGVLTENYGVCSGYSDTMMLFLEKFNIKSIKIASENHVWNYVNLDDNWWHLDLTWDDPISDSGDLLEHTYFLIDSNTIKKLDSTEHYYNETIYK